VKQVVKLTKGPRLFYCHFDVKKEHELDIESVEVELDYKLQYELDESGEDESEVDVKLSVKTYNDMLPFDFDVCVQGKFDFPKNYKKGDEQQIVATNTVPILLIYLREMVADITRKSYHPTLYILDISAEDLLG
jgi:preprotein translocase subunit SecB